MVAIAEILTAERKGKKLCTRCELYLENCGYRYDAETENYYVRNRYYSPTLGRWLARDPVGYQGGTNLYGYVNSSPVGNVDAEGGGGVRRRVGAGDRCWRHDILGEYPDGCNQLRLPFRANGPRGWASKGGGGGERGGLDIWIEGTWWGHERICVGDPTGSYTAFSFGLTSRWDIFKPFAKGAVYVATGRNGSREDMIHITAAQERDALYILQQQVGKEMPYRLSYPNCRTFCSVNLELLKERYAHPPSARGNCSGQPCTH
jgi:RHS repeat-associated protein